MSNFELTVNESNCNLKTVKTNINNMKIIIYISLPVLLHTFLSILVGFLCFSHKNLNENEEKNEKNILKKYFFCSLSLYFKVTYLTMVGFYIIKPFSSIFIDIPEGIGCFLEREEFDSVFKLILIAVVIDWISSVLILLHLLYYIFIFIKECFKNEHFEIE